MLNEEQIRFAMECFEKWAWIRKEEENEPVGFDQLACDIGHSSLLRRLLNGEKAFAKAPPLMHGYPDVELAAGEKVRILSLTTLDDDRVIIEGCADWKWDDKEEGLLIHIPTGDYYQLSGEGVDGWEVSVNDWEIRQVFIEKR